MHNIDHVSLKLSLNKHIHLIHLTVIIIWISLDSLDLWLSFSVRCGSVSVVDSWNTEQQWKLHLCKVLCFVSFCVRPTPGIKARIQRTIHIHVVYCDCWEWKPVWVAAARTACKSYSVLWHIYEKQLDMFHLNKRFL